MMKTALVTGGSRGIGRGIALALAAEGYDLAISRLAEPVEAAEVVRLVQAVRSDARCIVIEAELADEDAPKRLVQDAVAALGHIDLLVNNAGYTEFDEALGDDPVRVSRLIHVGFRAYYLGALAAAAHMAEQGIAGSIINISSSRAERAYPDDAVYGGVKAAVRRSTESLALRFAPRGIRINCVAPGAIVVRHNERADAFYGALAGKVPLGRTGTPEDVGNAVVWLASDRASYVTGITLRVDGGLILPGMPERMGEALNNGWGAHATALFDEGRDE